MMVMRVVMSGVMPMSAVFVLASLHHAHHEGTAGSEKDNAESDEYDAENDVQHGGVVEGNCCVHDCCMPLRRDPSE